MVDLEGANHQSKRDASLNRRSENSSFFVGRRRGSHRRNDFAALTFLSMFSFPGMLLWEGIQRKVRRGSEVKDVDTSYKRMGGMFATEERVACDLIWIRMGLVGDLGSAMMFSNVVNRVQNLSESLFIPLNSSLMFQWMPFSVKFKSRNFKNLCGLLKRKIFDVLLLSSVSSMKLQPTTWFQVSISLIFEILRP